MTPPCYVFPVSQLERQVQKDVNGKRRKHELGKPQRIDLAACELFEMIQYNCEVEQSGADERPVTCFELPRAFRRCQDRKGTFTVETTAWEGVKFSDTNDSGSVSGQNGDAPSQPQQWPTGSHDASSTT